jgi:hypothetical protein
VYRYASSAGQDISNTVTKHPTIFFIPRVTRRGMASHRTQILVTCCRSKFVVMELTNFGRDSVISWLTCFKGLNLNNTSKSIFEPATSTKYTGNGNFV